MSEKEIYKGVVFHRNKVARNFDDEGKVIRYVARLRIEFPDNRPDEKKSFSSKRRADAVEARAVHIANLKEKLNIGDSSLTFANFFDIWLTENKPNWEDRTYESKLTIYRLYLKESLSKKLLIDIDQDAVSKARNEVAESVSNDAANRMMQVLKSVLRLAVFKGKILKNPADGFKKLKHKNRPKHIYSETELTRIFGLLDGQNKNFTIEHCRHIYLFVFVLVTGLSYQEVVPLKADDVVYFENPEEGGNVGYFNIDEAVTNVSNQLRLKAPKTESRSRRVYFTSSAKRVLALQKDMVRYEAKRKGYKKNSLLFPSRNGGLIPNNSLWKALNRMNEAIKAEKHVTLHGLRHTYASVAIHKGVDPVKLSEHLGHSNPQVTMTIYAHFFRQVKRRPNDVFEDIFEKASLNNT